MALEAATPECQNDGKATVRFTITDTGIGIRADQVAALFSPFTQADDSTTRKYGGTGLGLAICKQLVEMMGGKIGIDSREGQGSTFWFTAAFEMATDPALASTVRRRFRRICDRAYRGALRFAEWVDGQGTEPRILVAEDNATNRAVALAQLEKLGYQVRRSRQWRRSRRSAAAWRIRSGSDGLRDAGDGRLRSDPPHPQVEHPRIPIIALTASAMSGDRERCIREGMNDYLSKPVELQQLAEVLAKWCPTTDPVGHGPIRRSGGSEQAGGGFRSRGSSEAAHGRQAARGRNRQRLSRRLPDSVEQPAPAATIEADGAGARLQAHALRGSAATVSACSLSAIAAKMEETAGAGEWGRFGTLLPRAVEEFELLKSTLEHVGWL